ncbi:MAG TPA: hypothetical protein VKA47_09045 [Solirubrobacterales bacterium]|nr:hypothetical protein [Solirubrobacterales bacterium]
MEVTLTPTPVNPDTRVLSMKSATYSKGDKRYMDPRTGRLTNVAELHAHTKAMAKRMEPIQISSFEC